MRRRRRKASNKPLTVRLGGRRHTWRALSRKYGPMKAKKLWRRAKKYHGYSRTRVHNGKRRRARNSWKGHKRAHRKAARKGWRRRGRKYSSRRRKGVRKFRYRGKLYSPAALSKKIGKTKYKKFAKRRGRRGKGRRSFRK